MTARAEVTLVEMTGNHSTYRVQGKVFPNGVPSSKELANGTEELCLARCDHGSPCLLPDDHEPSDRHETEHGCIFYDIEPKDEEAQV